MADATDRSSSAPRRFGRARSVAALLLLAGLWVAFFASLGDTRESRPGDFIAYHEAARRVLAGDAEKLYSEGRQWYVNLPVVAGVLAPLGQLRYDRAWAFFWWLQVASFGACFGLLLWGLARYFPPLTPTRALAAGAILLCFAPVVRRSLYLGQTTPITVAMLAGVWLLMRANRPCSAGALLGVIGLVKIPPLLLLPLLVARRRLAVAGAALAVVAAGVLVSWLWFGGDLLAQWAERAVWGNAGGSFAAFNNVGLDGAWMRLLTERLLLDFDPLPRPTGVLVAGLASAAGLGVLLWLRGGRALLWPARPPDDADPVHGALELELALGVCLMLLLFPIVWIHYYLFLAVPLVLLPFWWIERGIGWRPAAVLLIAAGAWLASGREVPPNHEVAAQRHAPLYRAAQNLMPLGALLLAVGLSEPLAELGRRTRPPR